MNLLTLAVVPTCDITLAAQPDISLPAAYLGVPREHEALRMAHRVLLMLPVINGSVERSFSKLALIKSKLRTTMRQERLEALMFCAVDFMYFYF